MQTSLRIEAIQKEGDEHIRSIKEKLLKINQLFLQCFKEYSNQSYK